MNLELINILIGKTVTFIRLAGNSLIVYLECMPGEGSGYSIWLEPTWHIHDNKKVVLGSRQLQIDDEEELKDWVKTLNNLHLRRVNQIEINPVSNDISIKISQYVLKTFVADPTDEFIWQIKGIKEKMMIEASPVKIELKEIAGKNN